MHKASKYESFGFSALDKTVQETGTILVEKQDTEQQFLNLAPTPSPSMGCLFLLAWVTLIGGGGTQDSCKTCIEEGMGCQRAAEKGWGTLLEGQGVWGSSERKLCLSTSAWKEQGGGREWRRNCSWLPKTIELVPQLLSEGLWGGLIISQHIVLPVLCHVCSFPPHNVPQPSQRFCSVLLHLSFPACRNAVPEILSTCYRVACLYFERKQHPAVWERAGSDCRNQPSELNVKC